MEPLTIALIVLVIAGIWAVIELALFLRRTRKSVADVTDSLNQTIVEFQPTVAKLDGIVDELGSSSKQLEPILEKASTTVDLVNVNLVRTESVLADVNTATNTAANLTTSVSATAGNAAAAVAGAVNKVAGKVTGKAKPSKLANSAEPARLAEAEPPVVEKVAGDSGYFTYPGAASENSAAAESPSVSVENPSVFPGTENVGGLDEPEAQASTNAADELLTEAVEAMKSSESAE